MIAAPLSEPARAMLEALRLLVDRSHVVSRRRGAVIVEFGASAFDRFVAAIDLAAGDADIEDSHDRENCEADDDHTLFAVVECGPI